ncbi:MAG TPA: hypothetical protein VH206_13180 [Xanthobacteraceae bacterium]|jgi:hypothetical protein|nr:hypothetical protein [Xanthobacteraceae bacterium]
MALSSAAKEISQWAERCRTWATAARTREQKIMLHSLEMVLSKAAAEAEDTEGLSRPFAMTKS